MPRISVFASTAARVIVPDSQAGVKLLTVRRIDSQGNLCALDRVVNRPMVTTAADRVQPSAPSLPHAEFHADYAGWQSAHHRAASPRPVHGARPASREAMTAIDNRWGPPPLYSAPDATSRNALPAALLPPYEAPPAYTPADEALFEAPGMRETRV